MKFTFCKSGMTNKWCANLVMSCKTHVWFVTKVSLPTGKEFKSLYKPFFSMFLHTFFISSNFWTNKQGFLILFGDFQWDVFDFCKHISFIILLEAVGSLIFSQRFSKSFLVQKWHIFLTILSNIRILAFLSFNKTQKVQFPKNLKNSLLKSPSPGRPTWATVMLIFPGIQTHFLLKYLLDFLPAMS